MKLSHEKFKTRDLGGNYAALGRELGGWSERVEDPGEIAGAFQRARRQTEEGRACCSSSSPAPRRRSRTGSNERAARLTHPRHHPRRRAIQYAANYKFREGGDYWMPRFRGA